MTQGVTASKPVSAETIGTSTTSAQSSAIGSTSDARGPTYSVQVRAVALTEGVWLEFGSNPTAVAESAGALYLPAGVVEYFYVAPGDKIAAITASGTGDLNIAVMA